MKIKMKLFIKRLGFVFLKLNLIIHVNMNYNTYGLSFHSKTFPTLSTLSSPESIVYTEVDLFSCI